MSRYSKTVVVSICYSIINGNRRIIEAYYPFERLTTDREASHPNKLIKPFPYTTTMIMGMYEEMQNRTKTKSLYVFHDNFHKILYKYIGYCINNKYAYGNFMLFKTK